MSYYAQQACPDCGRVLPERDRDGAVWECRYCNRLWNVSEVVA